MRMRRVTRNLMFRDRAGISNLAAEVLPRAPMLLIHDHPDAGISAEDLKTLRSEMAAVAQPIETGVIPRALTG